MCKPPRPSQFQDTPGASGPPGGGQLGLRAVGGGGGQQLYSPGAGGYAEEEDEYEDDSFLVNGANGCWLPLLLLLLLCSLVDRPACRCEVPAGISQFCHWLASRCGTP